MNVIQGKGWEVQQDLIFTVLLTTDTSYTWSSKNSSELRTLCVRNMNTNWSTMKDMLTQYFGDVSYEEARAAKVVEAETARAIAAAVIEAAKPKPLTRERMLERLEEIKQGGLGFSNCSTVPGFMTYLDKLKDCIGDMSIPMLSIKGTVDYSSICKGLHLDVMGMLYADHNPW